MIPFKDMLQSFIEQFIKKGVFRILKHDGKAKSY